MSQYNPQIHNRRSMRLKGYDYSRAGLYFVTICCQDRAKRFGKIENGEMILNEFGQIAFDEWIKLSERFPNFELDTFQIMPDHMHGIISLTNKCVVGAGVNPAPTDIQNDSAGATLAVAPAGSIAHHESVPPSISDIIGAYKSLVANGCLKIYKSRNEIMGKIWQRNYHEHIIRTNIAYHNISRYIKNNPANWKGN